MKNLVYAGIIVVCILLAVVVFIKTRGGGGNEIPDTQMQLVKCLKCGQSYELPLKQYLEDCREKSLSNPSPTMPVFLTCRECGKDGIVKAIKCEKCGEIFRAGSVPNDIEDRCPKCKYSATEAKREANKAKMRQQQGG
ncbi:MAG TPA: hypothetical protein PKH24_12365 [Sedimentisphaerales bacterium]|jgi:phage FluMu protein Com|nr:hypothetical protein [Sedimentisphaerales bacterium]HNU30067.1 hypothetical protein [Sedimentisphaerales bacterium]